MEGLNLLLTAGIFFTAFLALLLAGFNSMLAPLKKDIARLEIGQAKLSANIDNLKSDIAEIKQLLAKK